MNTINEKLVLELAKITDKIKLRFSVTFSDYNPQFPNHMIKSYNYGNSDYFKVIPKPYLSVDITDNNGDYNGFCLTKYLTFRMINSLKEFINCFNEKDLFYLDKNGSLSISTAKQNEHQKFIAVCSNKSLKIIPAVVRVNDDGGTGKKEYEGCVMYINSNYSYVTLTNEEIGFLIYTLEHIDYDMLSIQLMNSYKLYKNDIVKSKYTYQNNEPQNQTNDNLTGRGYMLEENREIPFLN